MKININKADALNFLTAVEYLKDLLATTDVSDDFAADENDYVTAYDLLTDTPVFEAIKKAAEV